MLLFTVENQYCTVLLKTLESIHESALIDGAFIYLNYSNFISFDWRYQAVIESGGHLH